MVGRKAGFGLAGSGVGSNGVLTVESVTGLIGSASGASSTGLGTATAGFIVGRKAAGFDFGASVGSLGAESGSADFAGFIVGRKAAGFGFGGSS